MPDSDDSDYAMDDRFDAAWLPNPPWCRNIGVEQEGMSVALDVARLDSSGSMEALPTPSVVKGCGTTASITPDTTTAK